MSNLIAPEGFVKGCLPKEHLPGEICGFARDHIKLIDDPQEISELIGVISLKPYHGDIYNQNGAGSCAAESAAGLYRAMGLAAGYDVPRLNPWSVYRITSGGRDNGSSLGENLRHMRGVGVLPESYFPRGGWTDSRIQNRPANDWSKRPPSGWEEIAKHFKVDEFWEITSVGELVSAVLREFGVTFGWDGHSCYIVELVDENTAIYANSWGGWGNGGFGRIRLRDVDFRYGAYCYRSVRDPKGWEDVAAPLEASA
jgi:hypothetical protein